MLNVAFFKVVIIFKACSLQHRKQKGKFSLGYPASFVSFRVGYMNKHSLSRTDQNQIDSCSQTTEERRKMIGG